MSLLSFFFYQLNALLLNKIFTDPKLLNGNALNYWKFYSAHSLGREKPGVNYTNEFIKPAAVTIWLNRLTTLAKVETIPISFLNLYLKRKNVLKHLLELN